ncbi:MAG: DUF6371 domain-containing protein, partial [Bacteroidales bacterium]|nr:DUF6371 domain-containing protein [Bacteroidales bacterium]
SPNSYLPKSPMQNYRLQPSFIDPKIVDRSCDPRHYPLNPLYRFLITRFDENLVSQAFRRYRVGTSKKWGGATVFWQHDIQGRCRTGKVMGYDPSTGHRVKQPHPLMHWAHCLIGPAPKPPQRGLSIRMAPPRLGGAGGGHYQLEQCYFGEHLLRGLPRDREIRIVESEKTALLASIAYPDNIWIATGGISNLRPSQALYGRSLILFPDLRAEEQWRVRGEEIASKCYATVDIYRHIQAHASDTQCAHGLDLADFILANHLAFSI